MIKTVSLKSSGGRLGHFASNRGVFSGYSRRTRFALGSIGRGVGGHSFIRAWSAGCFRRDLLSFLDNDVTSSRQLTFLSGLRVLLHKA